MACTFDHDDKASWYFGSMSRQEATDLLLAEKEGGVFLVRDSSTSVGDYVLCVKEDSKVSHYIINKIQKNDQLVQYRIGDQIFNDLPSLLKFYMVHYLDTTPLIRPAPRKIERVVAKYDFEGQDIDDLPFKKGEILTVISKDEEQWWTARNSVGAKGSIPVPYVQKCEDGQSVVDTTRPGSGGPISGMIQQAEAAMKRNQMQRKLPAMARVKQVRVPNAYDKTALKLEVGDIIRVTKTNINGQWEGELNGKSGHFPFTHVEFLDTENDNVITTKVRTAMARSKFPGKPNKPVNRTRINVLHSTDTDSLSNLNNETKQGNCESIVEDVNASAHNSVVRTIANRKRVCKTIIARRRRRSSQKLISLVNDTVRTVRKKADKRSENETSKKLIKTCLETNNLVGKFMLPSKSVHSSRVIKPNKRFINVEAVNSVQLRTFKKRVVNKKVDPSSSREAVIDNEEQKKENQDSNNSHTACSSRRIILRQARLQLHTQTPIGPEGPFSSNHNSNISPPGTVTCGVCGAVRFYRFVKQARKFNIYSCESCRKFISKMIKRQSSNKKLPNIECLKGQGTCHVPPVVRSQHWKFRCAYKARCNACWLKMCIRSFQIPPVLKKNLVDLLPEYMRDLDSLFNTSLFSFHTSANATVTSTPPVNKIIEEPPQFHVRRRPLRKKIVKETILAKPVNTKCQKIDVKGPRVKHVCRSASIVLGQPLAMFPGSDKRTETIKKSEENEDTSEDRDTTLENKSISEDVFESLKMEKITKLQPNSLESKRKRSLEGNINICLDFWENYDLEEVCRNGFGLIASLSFPMFAVCYLCGSAGQDSLLYCCLCCEPYHIFCLEQPPQNIDVNDNCYNWLCPRCTMCSACGEADKQKINCQKCHRAYHPECFNTKWRTDDRPTVCLSCMRCKSCGVNNITKFVGNTPLCLMCFRLRKKGNFCPLCQKCYDDNDFDTKMMECAKCNMWIHAKCEGLSDEQYEILSLLPESVEFLCCICEPLPYWRKAVDSELRSSFNNVLRLLSKNRVARNMLKLSPTCFSSPNSKTTTAVRKLQFSDESDLSNDSSGEENDPEKMNIKRMQKKYKLKELQVAIKPCDVNTEELLSSENEKVAIKTPNSPCLTKVKNKLDSKEYFSLKEFHETMVDIFQSTKSSELLDIYCSILKQVFPWYNSAQVSTCDTMNTSFCNTYSDISKVEDASATFAGFKHKIVNNIENDNRVCALCKSVGDGPSCLEARLLYCGNNEWVHANCALWSSEVYEEIDGSLQNVHSAISRGRYMRCAHCKLKGASIGCCAKSCYETYHFSCAHTVKCFFMQDKSIYCPSHGEINNESVISSPNDFAIRRSVYVELDKKKKRYIEPKKVQFMVGSLCVTNLGVIAPFVSDNAEAIIPTSFVCRRLFWSTSEPWKLIPYVITTRVLSSQSNNVVKDHNFTVDHSLSKTIVDKKMKDILSWQKDLENNSSGCTDFEDDYEPQNENATDILSPELTDAILEELPHEFLDGISMQDIFPKLMSNEELMGMDFKVPDMGSNDQLNESNKKNNFFEENKELFDSFCDKDSKADPLPHLQSINRITKARNQQRACSVMLNCKVDNSLSTKPIKADKSMYLKLLQLDGACDSGSDSESTTHEIKNSWTAEILDQPVKCERCQCTYRTSASYKRHLATCEEISTSESDSDVAHEHDQIESLGVHSAQANGIDVNPTLAHDLKYDTSDPYMLTSYESYSAFRQTQNEVQSSTYVSTESATEMVSVPQNSEIYFSNFQPIVEQKNVPALFTSQNASTSINQPSTVTINQSSNSSICESPQVTLSINQSSIPINHINTNPSNDICVNQSPSLYISHPNCNSLVNHPSISVLQSPLSVTQPNTLINTTTPLHINQSIEVQPQQLAIQPVPIRQDVSSVLNINPKLLTTSNMVAQTVTVPHNQFIKPMFKPTIIAQKPIRNKGRPRSLAAKRTRQIGPRTVFIPQSSAAGSMVVQQLPSTNMIPTFIETFQQQTGHNLQYIATITPQITPTVAPPPQLVQLQPEGTLVNLVPGVQPTVLLPQTRILNDQILVDNNGSLMWAPQPVQPVFYGFETIVQNTFLQSQQFLPTTVSGVLTTNSSYSSTTQVFQTSKLEPVLDVASGNIVLLNSNTVVNSQPLQVPQSIPNQISTTPLVLSEPKPAVPWSIVESNNEDSPELTPVVAKSCNTTICSNSVLNTGTSNSVITSSINLPVAPFIPEPGIPTNIVTPTPKPVLSTIPPRPMNRVLPMPTSNLKQLNNKISTKTSALEKPIVYQKIEATENQTKTIVNKTPTINIVEDILIKPITNGPVILEKIETIIPPKDKDESASLKLIFQKQNDGSLYKISNNCKNTTSVQVAPLKPLKPKTPSTLTVTTVDEETINNCNSKQNIKSDKPESAILFNVESQDGFNYSSTSISEAWSKVFEEVQAARLANNMSPLPSSSLNMNSGLQVLGLKTNGLKYLIEQLPDVGKCVKYKPIFHTPPFSIDIDEDGYNENPNGSGRFLIYKRTHEPNDLFGWLASKHRKPPNLDNCVDFEQYTRRGSITNLPMAMRFRHLKLTSKKSVGVYRSKIHKRGLFCHRDIESGEMVIEYAGEVIRSVLADKREKQYTLKGMGCYMFRIDENFVVDATMKGNAARFINHSCDPNCYSKVVEILGHKHIIIFALRKIICGEELTYDYKFPFEEDKIPCTCGSRRCRKFLN
ncbi:hypothetical protein FQR65_LT04660 [Abscondita terminalis]|nr:hypothetical protein FQR65_LT04660 [Abscondita terminalis]